MHLTTAQIQAGIDHVRESPADAGRLELIVRRPAVEEREVLEEGLLDTSVGLVGDNWAVRGSSSTPDGKAHPGKQLNLINSRFARLVAVDPERAVLAGDQLHVDLDLSVDNLPAGTRLHIGEAVIEVTPEPHTGCQKFSGRFGVEALRFANSPVGSTLRLRGLCARVLVPGAIHQGDVIEVERVTAPTPQPTA